MKFKSNVFLTAAILFTLILTSCGSNNNAIIATSVALTVQAQNTQAASVTDTPLPAATNPPLTNTPVAGGTAANTPAAIPTLTPLAAQPTVSSPTTFCTANATFVSETVPDGTIESPGAQYLKTWTIKNTGTCTWDTTWKLVYVSGDLMGGTPGGYALSVTPPGQNMDLSIALTAPTDYGTYTGYWKLESPWGLVFGDSGSGNPFWVTINVNSGTAGPKTPTVYGVTSVTYDYSTAFGNSGTCSPNVFLTTTATISVSGPLKISYYWAQSDGGRGDLQNLTFTDAGTVTIKDTWPLRAAHEIGLTWEEIVVTTPVHKDFVNLYARYDHECQ
ncbi:MAG TPA: NBR1-Ig-like domain-containing protein [Anaerolineales bacterium]|nr:NBR1-Ig-like domain-containing protein [Anaerolineales bacterium]